MPVRLVRVLPDQVVSRASRQVLSHPVSADAVAPLTVQVHPADRTDPAPAVASAASGAAAASRLRPRADGSRSSSIPVLVQAFRPARNGGPEGPHYIGVETL